MDVREPTFTFGWGNFTDSTGLTSNSPSPVLVAKSTVVIFRETDGRFLSHLVAYPNDENDHTYQCVKFLSQHAIVQVSLM